VDTSPRAHSISIDQSPGDVTDPVHSKATVGITKAQQQDEEPLVWVDEKVAEESPKPAAVGAAVHTDPGTDEAPPTASPEMEPPGAKSTEVQLDDLQSPRQQGKTTKACPLQRTRSRDALEKEAQIKATDESFAKVQKTPSGKEGFADGFKLGATDTAQSQPPSEEMAKRMAFMEKHDCADTDKKLEDAMYAVHRDDPPSEHEVIEQLEKEQQERSFCDAIKCCACFVECKHWERCGFRGCMTHCQSGDIFLFNNNLACNTCIISTFQRSEFDHVGMVVRKPGGGPNDVFLLEALSNGVLLDRLYSVMHWVDDPNNTKQTTDPGVMFWRPMRHPGPASRKYPWGTIDPKIEEKIWILANEMKGRAYEKNLTDFVIAGVNQDCSMWQYCFGQRCCSCCQDKYDRDTNNKAVDTVYCSELTAFCYLEAGFMAKRFNARMFLPKDFSSDPHATAKHHLNHGYELEREKLIVRSLPEGYKYDPSKKWASAYKAEDSEAAERTRTHQAVENLDSV